VRLLVPRTAPQVPVNPARPHIDPDGPVPAALPPHFDLPPVQVQFHCRDAAHRRTHGRRITQALQKTPPCAPGMAPLTQRPGLAAKCHRATYRNEKRLLGILRSHITSDIRVIISTYRIEKSSDDHPYI
jgi:hypothetical protein